jgi:hypothetical protein
MCVFAYVYYFLGIYNCFKTKSLVFLIQSKQWNINQIEKSQNNAKRIEKRPERWWNKRKATVS